MIMVIRERKSKVRREKKLKFLVYNCKNKERGPFSNGLIERATLIHEVVIRGVTVYVDFESPIQSSPLLYCIGLQHHSDRTRTQISYKNYSDWTRPIGVQISKNNETSAHLGSNIQSFIS